LAVPLGDFLPVEAACPVAVAHRQQLLAHDPEKWEPVFGKDHAQTKCYGSKVIQSKRIML
jgi:hypothetical protein